MRLRLEATDSAHYAEVVPALRTAYDGGAAARSTAPKAAWKLHERAAYLDRLRAAEAQTLLEVGAGAGQDSEYFQSEGLTVTAVDLSPEMVAHARSRGVNAHVRDVLDLNFPAAEFDALYSINTLLHVPNTDLPDALEALHRVLKPGGLFYLGVFGGDDEEGIATDDQHIPPRFFAFRSNQTLLTYATKHFDVLDFHVHQVAEDLTFQALTLVHP